MTPILFFVTPDNEIAKKRVSLLEDKGYKAFFKRVRARKFITFEVWASPKPVYWEHDTSKTREKRKRERRVRPIIVPKESITWDTDKSDKMEG